MLAVRLLPPPCTKGRLHEPLHFLDVRDVGHAVDEVGDAVAGGAPFAEALGDGASGEADLDKARVGAPGEDVDAAGAGFAGCEASKESGGDCDGSILREGFEGPGRRVGL